MTGDRGSGRRAKIVMVHPAVNTYRIDTFNELVDRVDPCFVFIGYEAQNRSLLPLTTISRYRILRERSCFPYRQGVSLELLRFAARSDYDVWIASIVNSFATHWAWPIVKARRKKFLLWSEDWWWPSGFEGRVARLLGRLVVLNADGVVVAGSRSRRFFLDAGVNEARITVAPNACPVPVATAQSVADTRRRIALGGDGPVFLYLNRVVEYKGLDVAIRAFSEVRRHLYGATLVVVGDGPHLAHCRRLASEVGVSRDVCFVGAVSPPEVGAFYRAADVYVHPARLLDKGRVRAEAWGFTINEAFAMGVPVVATDAVAAAQDLVEPSVSGEIVRAGDFAALAAAMIDVGERPDRAAMGAHGQKRVSTGFTAERQAAGFAEAVERVRGGPGAGGCRQTRRASS